MSSKSRKARLFLYVPLGIVALLVGLLIFLLSVDHGYLAPRIEARLSAALGTEVRLAGPVHLTIGDRIRFSAEDVHIKAPAWSTEPDLLQVASFALAIRTKDLLAKPLVIESIRIDGISANLEKNEQGDGNWELPISKTSADDEEGDDDAFPVLLKDVAVNNAAVRFRSPELDGPVEALIESLTQTVDDDRVLNVAAAGNVNGTPLTLSSRIDDLDGLIDLGKVGFEFDASLGEIRLEGTAAFAELADPRQPLIQVKLSGPDVAYLSSILQLRERHSGPLQLDIGVKPGAEGNTEFDINGHIGEFVLATEGSFDNLQQPQHLQGHIKASGPDAGRVAEFLGIDGLPNEPFSIDGNANQVDQGADIDVALSLPESIGSVTVAGNLAFADTGTRARLTVSGADATRLSSLLGGAPLVEEAYVLRGTAVQKGKGADLDLKLDIGEQREALAASGTLSFPGNGVRSNFVATGPVAQRIGALFSFDDLPQEAFSLRGKVDHVAGATDLDLSLDLGATPQALVLAGKLEYPASGLRAGFTANGPDAALIATALGVDGLPAEPFSITGNASRAGQGADLDLQIDLRQSAGPLSIQGNVTPEENGLTARLAVGGQNAQRVGQLFDADWLPAEPFTLQGTASKSGDTAELDLTALLPASNQRAGFAGSIQIDEHAVRANHLRASLNDNVLSGTVQVARTTPPAVTAELSSEHLDLRRWFPPIDPEVLREQEEQAAAKTKTRLIPDVAVPYQRLQKIDLTLKLSVAELLFRAARLRELELDGEIHDGALQLHHLSLKDADGGNVSLQAKITPAGNSGRIQLRAQGEKIKLGLTELNDEERIGVPHYDAKLLLDLRGATVRELAASANGYLGMFSSAGRIKTGSLRLFTQDFAYELLTTINPFLKKDPYSTLECAVVLATIADGKLDGHPLLVMQTDRLNVVAKADVNLATEDVDMDFNTVPRKGLGISLSNIVNPYIKVKGTLAHPQLAIDKQRGLIEGGAAFATGGISIVAKSLFDRVTTAPDPCGEARKDSRQAFEQIENKYGGDLSVH